ncbi:TPA: murein tripeptide amidase MpaA, partial [Serratia marcescens]
MTEHRPRSERGQLAIAGENYGSSLLGAPLLYFPAAVSGPQTGLIIAGTHGDES